MTTNTWTVTSPGAWSAGSNWSDRAAPVDGQDVLIASGAASAHNITYDVSTLTINSLTLSDTHAVLKWKIATESLTVSNGTTITAGTFNSFQSGSTFITGSLSVTAGTFNAAAGSVTVNGLASFSGGSNTIGTTFDVGTLSVGSTVTFSGGITTLESGGGGAAVGSGGTMKLTGATIDATNGGVALSGTGKISDRGIVEGHITNDGSNASGITASGGTLDLTGVVDSGPSFTISTGSASDLKFDNTATARAKIAISNANQTLEIGSSGALTINALESITNGTIQMDGGSLTDPTGLTLGSGSTLKGSGTVNPTLAAGTGTVQASGGVLELVQNIAASTGLTFNIGTVAASVLKIDGTVGATNTFSFLTSGNDLNYANAAALTTTISGLNVGSSATVPTNFIDISNHTVTSSSTGTGTSGTISLSDGSVLTLSSLTGNTGGSWFVDTISDGSSGTEVFLSTASCYLRGTRILTVDGEVPVEDLSEGDMIVTTSGATRPVKWLGRRGYVTRLVSQHQRAAILPIRFARGSLGEGLPRRDLFVSPEHMMFLDDVLIAARNLVNGSSIDYCDAFPTIEYFHVELPSHDVILAEGAAAESWLNTGNRNMFANVIEYQPRDGDEEHGEPCAPIVTAGPRLIAVRGRLRKQELDCLACLE